MTATTTISKWGTSQAVRLPKPFLDSLKIKENDTVEILLDKDKLIIQKKYLHKTLKERIEEFHGKDFETALKENPYEFKETDWGKPVGKEVW